MKWACCMQMVPLLFRTLLPANRFPISAALTGRANEPDLSTPLRLGRVKLDYRSPYKTHKRPFRVSFLCCCLVC